MHMSSAKKVENGANQEDQLQKELIQEICKSVTSISTTRGTAARVAAAEAKLNWNIQEEYLAETVIEAYKTMIECPKDINSSVAVFFNRGNLKISCDDQVKSQIDSWIQKAHTCANEIATTSAFLSKTKDEFHGNFTASSQRLVTTLEKITNWIKAHPEVGEIADIWSEVNNQWNQIAAELANFDQHILEFTKKFDDISKRAMLVREQITLIIKQSLLKPAAQGTPSTLHIQ
jgi:hypothetical protein